MRRPRFIHLHRIKAESLKGHCPFPTVGLGSWHRGRGEFPGESDCSCAKSLCFPHFRVILSSTLVAVQLFSCVRLFAAPWTATHQASLSFTISRHLLKLMSIDSMMPSNHLILCQPPFSSCPQSF